MPKPDTSVRLLAVAFVMAAGGFAAAFGPHGPQSPGANPPAPGFNVAGSDAKAIELADRTMQAMGGRAAWDHTRHVAWNFFGRREHVWDRHTGDVRIEYVERESNQPVIVLMNINTKAGRAWIAGGEMSDGESLKTLLQNGYEAWVNDGYWLFMPYKLKDSGVTLKYLGERAMDDGRAADVIGLSFENVGVTPENTYEVFIAKDDGLVGQWNYFTRASDDKPSMTTPWREWKRYGRIMLSGDRGERNGRPLRLENIRVFDALPRTVFTSAAPANLPGG